MQDLGTELHVAPCKCFADLAALNARVEEMKTDLARCFMELSECGSESFADDIAVKYFNTWREIQKRAKGAE